MGKTYLDSIARQIRELVPRSELPDEDTHGLFRVYAVLALAKGELVEAADVHNAWVAWMLGVDPEHGALIPFNELDAATAADDLVYVEAIRTVSSKLDVQR